MQIDYGSAGVAFAIAGYVVFLAGVWINNLKLNSVTFLLYVIINGITLANVRALGGNTSVLYMFTVGSAAVFISLLIKKMFRWTKVETLISLLVVACLIVWWSIGQSAAVIAGATSAGLANIPQLRLSWEKPNPDTTAVWTIFLLSNLCFFLKGKDWSVEEVLYPIVAGSSCIIIIAVNLRKGINPAIA